jgi:uncharacterized protein involved in exopolysaccharide biosynthesis
MPLFLALSTLVAMLRRRLWQMLALLAVTCGLAAALIFTSPPSYVAETNVLVKFGREHSLRSYGEGDQILPVNYAQDQIVSSTIEMMQSVQIERRVVELLGYELFRPRETVGARAAKMLRSIGAFASGGGDASRELSRDEAAAKLKSAIHIAQQGRSNVIQVQLYSDDPETALLGVNTFLDEFLKRYREIHRENLVPQMQLEYDEALLSLRQAQDSLVAFERDNLLFEQDGQLERLAERKNQLEQQLLRLENCCAESAAIHTVRSEVDGLQQRLETAAAFRAGHRELLRERRWAEEQLGHALRRLQDARFSQSLGDGASSLQVISRAEPPLTTAGPGRVIRFVLACAFALIFSASTVLALEIFRRRYSSPEELQMTFGLPVLADLPGVKGRLWAADHAQE